MPRTIYNRFFIAMALATSLVLLAWIAGTNVDAQATGSQFLIPDFKLAHYPFLP